MNHIVYLTRDACEGFATGCAAISLPMVLAKLWTMAKGGKVHDVFSIATPAFRRQVVVGATTAIVVMRMLQRMCDKSINKPIPTHCKPEEAWYIRMQILKNRSLLPFAIRSVALCTGLFASSFAPRNSQGLYYKLKWAIGVAGLICLANHFYNRKKS